MAAKRGNKAISNKMSIAEELVSLITYEEYPEDVEAFGDTDYLNKNEVCALKKMISGKLWADSRKFTNRQNSGDREWTVRSLWDNAWKTS